MFTFYYFKVDKNEVRQKLGKLRKGFACSQSKGYESLLYSE